MHYFYVGPSSIKDYGHAQSIMNKNSLGAHMGLEFHMLSVAIKLVKDTIHSSKRIYEKIKKYLFIFL